MIRCASLLVHMSCYTWHGSPAQPLDDTAITPQVLLFQVGSGNYGYAALLLLLHTASIAAGATPAASAPSPRLRKLSSSMNSVTMSRYTCTSDSHQNGRAMSALTAGNPWWHPKPSTCMLHAGQGAAAPVCAKDACCTAQYVILHYHDLTSGSPCASLQVTCCHVRKDRCL
jgi:hypothetical protein